MKCPRLPVIACLLLATVGPPRSHGGEPKTTLEAEFAPLKEKFGQGNRQKAKIVSGPEKTKMPNDKSAGRVWDVAVGDVAFRLTIQDACELKPEDALGKLERAPAAYLTALRIVSEEGKAGVAFYKDLDGAAAHGSQEYLNMVPAADVFVVLHEAGHVLEQRATAADETVLTEWKKAVAADTVSVSEYGDGAVHEDLAEFAYVYAVCLDAGKEALAKLGKRSPERFRQWEQILKVAKAK